MAALIVAGVLGAGMHASAHPMQAASASAPSAKSAAKADPGKLFSEGEAALRDGQLDEAERAFKGVIAIEPQFAPAYGNLGVVHMRRKQWEPAIKALEKAAKLDPKMTGFRLNIGLAYYRQNDFWHAIPPLESVVKDQPDSAQARYLLGLCYFYTERWVEAADELEPLWPAYSNDMTYLYVLSISAEKAERKDLGERADERMVAVGGDSPEFQLIIGKAKLQEEAYDDAVQ